MSLAKACPKLWIVPLSRQANEDGDPMVVGLVVAQASDGVAEHGNKICRRVGCFEIKDDTVEELGWDTTNLPVVESS